MANQSRGQVPFRALGRDLFIQYGCREIAEIQTALGFRRPDPFTPDVVEDVDEPVAGPGGAQKVDDKGVPVFVRRKILVNAKERQRRMLVAFDACLLNPDPEAAVGLLRVGLRPWQRETSQRLPDELFGRIVDSLGLERIKMLHFEALSSGVYLAGEESEGKAESTAA